MQFIPKCVAITMVLGLVMSGSLVAAPSSPLPRFVSLKSGKVNLRTGPGSRYPVDWVLTHKNMPVKIINEHGNWRQVRDWLGTEGWIHHSLLSGRRTIMVTGDLRPLRREPHADSEIVATVSTRVIGLLLNTLDGWCEVDIQGYRGWLRSGHVWGLLRKQSPD